MLSGLPFLTLFRRSMLPLSLEITSWQEAEADFLQSFHNADVEIQLDADTYFNRSENLGSVEQSGILLTPAMV